MMKKAIRIGMGIVGVILLGIGAYMKQSQPAAVTIIGGADGPTSIFLAGKTGSVSGMILAGIGVGFIIALIIDYIRRKRRK